MTRMAPLDSPFLLGFDELEQRIGRLGRNGGGYPPYNIERFAAADGAPERLRITLAVAGFAAGELGVILEEDQLVIRGRQVEEGERVFLHRGIAARQFQRVFVLAEGLEVENANLDLGLLVIDLVRREPKREAKRIEIAARAARAER